MDKTLSAQILTERTTYFPSNLVRGVVQLENMDSKYPLELTRLDVVFVSEVCKSWSTSMKGSRTVHREHTPIVDMVVPLLLAADDDDGGGAAPTITLEGGQKKEIPFALQLPIDTVPTVFFDGKIYGDTTMRVQHCFKLNHHVKLHGKVFSNHVRPVCVLSLMSQEQHQVAAAETKGGDMDVNCGFCCACFGCGGVSLEYTIPRRNVALDRDAELHFRVKLDNSKGELGIGDIEASLFCEAQLKGATGKSRLPEREKICSVSVPGEVAPGETAERSGVLKIDMFATPSIKSGVIDTAHCLEIVARTSHCCATDVGVRVSDVFLAHSVDATPHKFAEQAQQALAAVPAAHYGAVTRTAANLYDKGLNIPVWQVGTEATVPPENPQFAPPPPPELVVANPYFNTASTKTKFS